MTYATDAPGVATIDAAGAVVTVAVGSATLTATCDAGSAQVPVTVTPLVFYEPFDGSALDTTAWVGTTTASSSQIVTGGVLRQAATVYNARASITTVNTFDFTGRSVQATYASSPIGLRVTTRLEVFDPVTLDGFRLELGSVGTVGTGVAYRVNNLTATNVGQFNYTFPAWATIRVRHDAATGNVTLERSKNVGATWSTIVTIPLSAVSVTLTAMKATLSTRGTATGTNAVDWDDVKIY